MIKVVLVDDEQRMLELLLQRIDWTRLGMEIAGSFMSAVQALEYIRRTEPDLVVTDMLMPQMDGNALIEQVSLTHPDIRFIVLSSYSDFQMVRSAFKNGVVDYVLKDTLDNDSLSPLLKEFRREYRFRSHHSFRDYIQSCLPDAPQGAQGLTFVVLVVSCRRSPGEHTGKRETGTPGIPGTIRTVRDGHACIVGFWNAAPDETELQSFPAQIRREINANLPADERGSVYIGMSRPGSFVNLEDLYRQAAGALNGKFYEPGTFLLKPYPLPKEDRGELTPEFWQRRIKTAVLQFDYGRIGDTFVGLFDNIKRLRIEEIRAKRLTFELMSYFVHHLDHDMIPSGLSGEDLSEIIREFSSFSGLRDWVMQQTKDVEQRYKAAMNSDLVRMVRMFIDQNYHQELGRSELARKFAVSEGYLSKRFSEETGVTLIQYINLVRIRQAKTYLNNSDYTVSEICDKVGFVHVEHFSRIFKKMVGVSPLQYRKT